MNNKNKEISEVKSLRWLANMFPYIENPQDDTDKMMNTIHVCCTVGADKIVELQKEIDFCSWIPVDIDVPTDTDIYEVTFSYGSCTYRGYAWYHPDTKKWKSELGSKDFINVLAWKRHSKLFEV